MKIYEQLLLENKAWAKEQIEDDPEYFQRLLDAQKPEFLWIGCSDSRVPPTQITQTKPGDIFLHRNIANVVVHTDLNLLSVLQYAVEQLKVRHVIVCGHYGCGGVQAAMGHSSYGILNKWLRHIKDVYRYHKDEIDGLESESDRLNRLIELNVVEQVHNLAKTSIIQRAWKTTNLPYLHGWVYDMGTGIIHPLFEMEPNSQLEDAIYEYDNLDD